MFRFIPELRKFTFRWRLWRGLKTSGAIITRFTPYSSCWSHPCNPYHLDCLDRSFVLRNKKNRYEKDYFRSRCYFCFQGITYLLCQKSRMCKKFDPKKEWLVIWILNPSTWMYYWFRNASILSFIKLFKDICTLKKFLISANNFYFKIWYF